MKFAGSAVVATLFTASQAFLLPPTISSADSAIIDEIPFGLESEADSRTINLECYNCPVAKTVPSGLEWVQDLENKLQLNFSVGHLSDIDVLYLNGFQIYPSNDFSPALLAAPQISTINPDPQEVDPLNYVRLGYELAIKPVPTTNDDHFDVIAIHLQIIELNDKFVDGLESVELKLLKATLSGSLMIAALETAPTTNPGGKECKSITCKLKSILVGKYSHKKPKSGCGGMRRPIHSIPVVVESQGPSHHGNHGHSSHHGFGRLAHGLKRFTRHILTPVLIGVCVGLTATLICVLLGRGIVLAWRTLYRRGQRKNCTGACNAIRDYVSQLESLERQVKFKLDRQLEFVSEDVKPPPMYEDAPGDTKALE